MKRTNNNLSGLRGHSRREFIKMGAAAGSMAFLPGTLGSCSGPRSENFSPEALLEMGFLDITSAPYFADTEGQKDSTEAIQMAVNDARDKGLVCFFPQGTFIISDTISCEQIVEKLPEPKHVDGGIQHYWPVYRPMILMGSTKGKRPVLKLSDDAKGFDDPLNPKKLIWIWAQTWFDAPGKEEPVWGKEQGNISFNHFFMNIDIDIRGHAGAIGIRHSGSQGSSMFNSTIYADGAFSGMNNCCGQGGGTYNFEVIGGRYGIWIDSDSRFPILTSCIFRDQTESSVSYYGRSIQVPTMFIGSIFKPKSGSVIDMTASESYGGVLIIDSVAELPDGGQLLKTNKTENIFLENVFLKGIERIYSNGQIIDDHQTWTHINQFSSHTISGVNLINGAESAGEQYSAEVVQAAPGDNVILTRHYKGVPGFEDTDAVNVKSFGAKGDGLADDTEAFRKAIESGKKIFLPKGNFKLSGLLELGSSTQIFGLTRTLSSISTGTQARRITGDIDSSALKEEQDTLKITTPDDPEASPGLFLISIRDAKINWRSGKGTWMLSSGSPLFSGNGGGKFYGLGAMGQPFIVDSVKQPLAFYTLNVERVIANPQSEIKNSSSVRIYYFKVEAGTIQPGSNLIDQDANSPGKISGSEDITIYCMYGNVKKLKDRPMLEIVNSKKVKVCMLKAFFPGEFPNLREINGGQNFEIPSTKTVSLFVRD